MSFSRISIIGLGLIGSSVARSVRAYMPDVRIAAMDADAATLKAAREMKLADICTQDAAEAVREAELVILAVPVEALEAVAKAITPHLRPEAIITDVASVKRVMLTLFPPDVAVVPAHPIAGSEKSGIHAGSATLLGGKQVILTPENPEAPGVQPVAEFWEALRMQAHFMPPGLHDAVYACVSHLPQYLAFHIKGISEYYNATHAEENLRRFLRLSGSDAAMWSGIFKCNKDNIDKYLNGYLQLLHQIKNELAEAPEEAPADEALVYGVLFPRVVASCMVHVAHLAERELQVPLKHYAGSGFADFIAPAMVPPEPHLEAISGQAKHMAKAVGDFAVALEQAHS